ncbi:unnamed protein product [Brachionus calyciflorus]|uniref:Uncharacterized protein n=1 Tax=Brachionus calyciflorus TaxID=104777 RepID=A0A814A1X9_9BILA|nr:unnamed protein product [Brachionus calyciflorus]
MKPAENKKCDNHKIAHFTRLIKTKETEKNEKLLKIEALKRELKQISKERDKFITSRNEIHAEINTLREEQQKIHDEMNRIKAGLIYKTKQHHIDMIRQYEKEMRFNTGRFKPNEEAKLLREISNLEQGIKNFEKYEEKQSAYEKIKETLKVSYTERNNLWKNCEELAEKFSIQKRNLNNLTREKIELDKEIKDLCTQKVDAKKELEDSYRQNLAKNQQAKKDEHALSPFRDHNFKGDDVVISLEYTLKDYNKLINYFYKLQNSEEIQTNLNSLITMGSLSNASTPTATFSLYHQTFENRDSTDTTNELSEITKPIKPTSLNFRKAFKSEDYTCTQTPFTLTQTPTYPLLPIPLEDNSSNAMFLLKKKSDDDEPNFSIQKRRSSKKPKQLKTPKVSHSVEVIQLLSKLNIPVHLSSQIDECLKVLNTRRLELVTQLELYKSKLADQQEETIVKNDNQSEISSLMDSNYESDSNSVCQNFDNDRTLTSNDGHELIDSRKSSKSNSSSSSDKTIKLSPKIDLKNAFHRQMSQVSDGYSSTPLSADSMNSELQTNGLKDGANPFFKTLTF